MREALIEQAEEAQADKGPSIGKLTNPESTDPTPSLSNSHARPVSPQP